jgi:hypothetical protein
MKRLAFFLSAFVLVCAAHAQNYQEINLSKIISFPSKYEGKAIAALGYKVHGEVQSLGDFYGIEVSSPDNDVYIPDYYDKVTFLITELMAERVTDKIEVGYWMWANIYGHVERVKNNTAAFNPATCIMVDRIDLITDSGRVIQRIDDTK